jgi:hypothetical protein
MKTESIPTGQRLGALWAVLVKECAEIALHTGAFLAALASMWLVHLATDALLGPNSAFFGQLPVQYVFDAGHLAVLVRFVWKLVREIKVRQDD